MEVDPVDSAAVVLRATARAQELRTFGGPPNEFWPAYLEMLAGLAGGAEAALLVVASEDLPARWRSVWEWRARGLHDERFSVLRNAVRLAVEAKASAESVVVAPLVGGERAAAGSGWLTASVLDAGGDTPAVVMFVLPGLERSAVEEGLRRVRLVADLPRGFLLRRQFDQARRDVETFASALDLVALLDAEKQFASAAMLLCNELASRHRCERVSLSWRAGPYLRLRAVSHMEKFEGRMTVVRQLEAAMEEAADQNSEIVMPLTGETSLITRDHDIYIAEQKPGNLCTLPLVGTRTSAPTGEGEANVVGALTCERAGAPFDEAEVRHLRLAADHAARRLEALERNEAWIGKRWAREARERLQGGLGVSHTLPKAAAIVGAIFLLWALVWPLAFEISAPFALRGADTAVISAPFDGYLAESRVEKGDSVTAGAVLAKLDPTEFALELGAAQADATRFEREVQQARSENKLAEMQVAQARAEQANAKVEILRRRLEQSELRAPFDGVVVEGDLRERAGAPLKQGDALFRVAHLERMFAEVLVAESDVRYVTAGLRGELAFASQPGERFAVTVERVEPLAQTRPEGNVFLVRCILAENVPSWWRPGMSGMAEIKAGRRSPFWQATRRTLDYMRLRWW